MTDASPDYLLNILDAETAKKVWSHLRGIRIYFPKCKSEHDEIRTLYKQMTTTRADRIRRLSELYEMSESQIRKVTKENKSLFEDTDNEEN